MSTDIFRILSRSTKLAKGTSKRPPSRKIPSSGEAQNPQLFGHDREEPEPNNGSPVEHTSRKRKRGHGGASEAMVLPPELDFFGDSPANADRILRASNNQTAGIQTSGGVSEPAGRQEDGPEDEFGDSYDGEKCKRILRSHKVKITILEDHQQVAQQVSGRKSKKQKKLKEEQTKMRKKSRPQLYPQPLSSFSQLQARYGISRILEGNIQNQGYKMPTEVQLASLPLLLGPRKSLEYSLQDQTEGGLSLHLDEGIDLLTVAPTGSGKTLTFLIPAIHTLVSQRRESGREKTVLQGHAGPQFVILAPTKELASQIVNEGRKLSLNTGVKIALMRKGMRIVAMEEGDEATDDSDPELSDEGGIGNDGSENEVPTAQGKALQKKTKPGQLAKTDILVSTPLTLLHAIEGLSPKPRSLPSVRCLILDEADVLLDPLFRDQTLSIWSSCTNPRLRISLWSATMGSSIEELACSTINRRWADLSERGLKLPPRPPLLRLVVGLKDSALPTITHKLTYCATEQGKLLAVRQLLHPTSTDGSMPPLRPPLLIFTQTIPRATALHSELLYDIPPEAGGSSRLAVLHADLPAHVRERTLNQFRNGEIWVLITTDLLARGVDFRGVNAVINYDVPNSAAGYVHRVGRTGRAGREGGVAVTLYTLDDVPYIKAIANIIAASEKICEKAAGNGDQNQPTQWKDKGKGIQPWLLDALPTPSKRDKQRLKRRGVEARRPDALKGIKKGRSKMMITTKSGFDRKLENRRKGAVEGSRERRESSGEGE